MSSSDESPKELEEVTKAPTNAKNKRKGKKIVEATSERDTKQTILDFESKTKCNADGTIETISVPKLWHFDQDEIRKALARMVVVDELPFSFVERKGFRHFCKIAVPSFVPPSRATITRDSYALFIEKRKKLKNYLSNLSSRA
ncbi:hypothetical protein V6N13_106556 [Hibiscus sabdariffa]